MLDEPKVVTDRLDAVFELAVISYECRGISYEDGEADVV